MAGAAWHQVALTRPPGAREGPSTLRGPASPRYPAAPHWHAWAPFAVDQLRPQNNHETPTEPRPCGSLCPPGPGVWGGSSPPLLSGTGQATRLRKLLCSQGLKHHLPAAALSPTPHPPCSGHTWEPRATLTPVGALLLSPHAGQTQGPGDTPLSPSPHGSLQGPPASLEADRHMPTHHGRDPDPAGGRDGTLWTPRAAQGGRRLRTSPPRRDQASSPGCKGRQGRKEPTGTFRAQAAGASCSRRPRAPPGLQGQALMCR